MRVSTFAATIAAVASFAAVGLVSPDASAIQKVYTLHGIAANTGAQDGVVSAMNNWDSAYVTVALKYYGYQDYDWGSAATCDGCEHNINFHGPSGLCNNGGGNYATDATRECPWGWDAIWSKCKGHGTTRSDSGTSFGYDHSTDADIRHIGLHLAWFFQDHNNTTYTSALVAHSMGGLVARSMFRRAGLTYYPSSASTAMVDNTITFGTPHEGVTSTPLGATQFVEIGSGSSFIADLRDYGGWSTDMSRVSGALNNSTSWLDDKDLAQDIGPLTEVKARSAVAYSDTWEQFDHIYMYGRGTTFSGGTWTLGSRQPSYRHDDFFVWATSNHGGAGYGDYYHQNDNGGYAWLADTAPASLRLAYRAINSGASY
jgi:hypothetical protein